MTREEAIKRIQDFIGWFKKDKPIYEALEMAIQALEQNESAEEWYKLFVKKLDEQEPCIYDLKNRYCPRLNEHGMLKYPLQEQTTPMSTFDIAKQFGIKLEPCDDAISHDFQIGDEVRIIGSDPIYDDCDVGWVIRNASEKVKTMYVMRNDGSAEEEAKAEWYKTGRHNAMLAEVIKALPSVTQKSGKCKNCKYFEYDSVAKVDGIPLIVAHEICNKWGDGCKTKEDGYCFLFEPQKRSGKE